MVARNSATIALAPERERLARRFRASAATLFTFTHRLGGRRRDHDVARIAAAALALAALAAVEPHGLFGDVKVRARKSDEELKPRLFDILS